MGFAVIAVNVFFLQPNSGTTEKIARFSKLKDNEGGGDDKHNGHHLVSKNKKKTQSFSVKQTPELETLAN